MRKQGQVTENQSARIQPETEGTAKPAEPEEQLEDEVDEASEESFPASDSPAWTGAAAH